MHQFYIIYKVDRMLMPRLQRLTEIIKESTMQFTVENVDKNLIQGVDRWGPSLLHSLVKHKQGNLERKGVFELARDQPYPLATGWFYKRMESLYCMAKVINAASH